MLHLNVRTLFVCLAALLFLIACADNQQKPAETETQTTETPEQTVETPSQTAAETDIEEVTLAVTGMTWGNCTSAVQGALSKVPGVSEVVSVSDTDNTAVVKIEKGKVETDALVKAVEGAGAFTAQVAN